MSFAKKYKEKILAALIIVLFGFIVLGIYSLVSIDETPPGEKNKVMSLVGVGIGLVGAAFTVLGILGFANI